MTSAQAGSARPDFYIAAIGRSGSTALCNWLTSPPSELVFSEPSFTRLRNPRLLPIQLAAFGMPASDEELAFADPSPIARFQRLMAPRLEGKRWALKEVLCEEHALVLDMFAPPRVLLTVRDIHDIALSFFEKHRIQDNLNRFSDQWVKDYCVRESAGLVAFRNFLEIRGIPHYVIRYEELTRSPDVRRSVASFVGWRGDGRVDSNFAEFDRGFEALRHGPAFSGRLRSRGERALRTEECRLAERIVECCSAYQRAFGYQ
ncbi:hypothetical protein [Sphingomonas arenae]|uniref:hypothetical protein n=1 Tax=Sphingomonas arenae TaxID=2812555 RepID=UPI0019678A70|nr:hypothetical protein [Sphingomonas arenae]